MPIRVAELIASRLANGIVGFLESGKVGVGLMQLLQLLLPFLST